MSDYRILGMDPSYEKIRGERRARSFDFFAGIAGWLAILAFVLFLLAGGSDGGILALVALGMLAAWLLFKLAAKFLYKKYET